MTVVPRVPFLIGGRELRDAARKARIWLGEPPEGEPTS